MTTPEPAPPDLLDTPEAGPVAIRGGVVRGVGYGLALALSLVSVPLLVRHLGVVDFGRYVIVTSLISLVAGLTEGGVQAVGMREYAVRTGEDRDRLMRNLLGVRLLLTIVGAIGAVAFTVLAGYDSALVLGCAVAAAALVISSTQTLLAVPLQAHLRLGWATAADLLRQSVLVALTIALIAAGAQLLPFFIISIPAALAGAILTAVLVRRAMPFRPAYEPAEWWRLLRETVPYAAAIAANVAYVRLAVVMMSLLSTDLETGYFAAAFRVLEVLLPLPGIAVAAVFPILARAARDNHERLGYASQRILEVAFIGGVGMVLVIELAAPTIIYVLAGDASDPSIEVLRLQAPALAATFVAVACGYPLLSLGRYRSLLMGALAGLAVSFVFCLALIPPLDARGAAIASTLAEFALGITGLVLLRRAASGWSLSLSLLPIVVLAAALGALAVFLPVPDLLQAIVAGAVYVGALALFGRIPAELRQAIPRRGQ